MLSPPKYIAHWGFFRLNALGLLTTLGGPEMSQAIGHLAFNRLAEFLSILGAYTVSGNDFTMQFSRFVLYNISNFIVRSSFAS